MTELSMTSTFQSDANSSALATSISFNGSIRTVIVGGLPPSTTFYSDELTINKDGSYKDVEVSDADVDTEEGGWAFVGKSEELGYKNKEAVVFTGLKYIEDDGYTDTYSGDAVPPDYIYVIDRLSKKEMVITLDYTNNDSDGYKYTQQGTITFEKQ